MTRLFVSVLLVLLLSASYAQNDKNQIERVWYNQEKTAKIEIYLAKNGKFYGKIAWLDEPNDPDTGKPKLDKENPEEGLKSNPVMGLTILKGYTVDPNDKNLYTGGTIYDPKNGKTYCGKLTYKGSELDLRGYICSLPILGRTSKWSVADN